MSVVLSVLGGSFIILLIYALLKRDPKPIFGVYSVPGKWYYVKYALFACLYYFRKYSSKHKAAGGDGRAGQGVKAVARPEDMDRAQPLSDHPKAFDAIFFISSKTAEDDKGIYVIAGCERRPLGMCNGLFYIGLPGKGLLCSKKIPDTVLFGAEIGEFGAEIGEFGAEGIKMTVLEPMRRWAVEYKGPMWYQNDPSKVVSVEFKGEWSATTRHFDFDDELHPPAVIRSIAREPWSRAYFEGLKTSIAREPWSRDYFEGLKTAHQSHYEQFGNMNCKFKIENESFEFQLPSFRDHSFGARRDWSLMHRYAFHHIFLEDGASICVGVICQPSTASVFEAGEMALPSGEVIPIKWVDLQLYQHGECGRAPRDYAFRFGAGDEEYTVQGEVLVLPIKWVDLQLYQHGECGQAPRDYAFRFGAGDEEYTVQVVVEYESVHFVSSQWEARMVERFCKFTVGGTPGRGVSEFHYRHRGGRPGSLDDPDWYRKIDQ